MNNKTDLFCYMPWIFTQITPAGGFNFCCLAQENSLCAENGSPLRFSEDTNNNDIMNSKKSMEIRKDLLQGKKTEACRSCWITEANGGTSLRYAINAGLSQYVDKNKLIQDTEASGFLKNSDVRYLELRLGNLCNMRCRFCGPQNSSSWYSDYRDLYEKETYLDGNISVRINDKSSYAWAESEAFFKWFEEKSSSLLNLQFVGGEPLLSETHHKIIKYLIETGKSSKLNLIYTSNGSVVDDWLFKAWKEFKSVIMFISIEGTERIYEYQRWPAKWDIINQNINKFQRSVGSSITKLVIQPNINVYNVGNIGELALWVMEQGKDLGWNAHINFVTDPSWQSAYILTTEEKNSVKNKIKKSILKLENTFPDSSKKRSIIEWLNSVQNIISSNDWSYLRKDFKKYNKRLDDVRNGYAKDYLDPLTMSFIQNMYL